MQLNLKKASLIFVGVAGLILIITVGLNFFISKRIKQELTNLPKHISVNYEAINSNIWLGKLSIKHPKIIVKGQNTNKNLIETEALELKVEGFSIWKYLLSKQIDVENISFNKSVSKMLYNSNLKLDRFKNKSKKETISNILIHNISLNDANVLLKNIDNDSIIFSTDKLNSIVKKLQIANSEINYKSFKVTGNNLFLTVNKFENLNISEFNISNKKIILSDVDLSTKYTKEALSLILKQERDHVKVNFKEINLDELKLKFKNGFSLSAQTSEIKSPEAALFRNKLMPDNFKTKPLYSKLLRDLNFKLNINTLKITDGKIIYHEKVNNDNKIPGAITFKDLNAKIDNLGNINKEKPVNILVDALFMEDSKCHVNWFFKVADTTDAFVFKADIKNLNASKINQFIEPNLKVKLKGQLQQTYFSVYGNNNISNTDLKIKYNNFEVSVLKENGKEKRKLLSGLVNLFVLENTIDDSDNFRYGKAENIIREKNKSVFSYVWINVKQGLLSAMMGS